MKRCDGRKLNRKTLEEIRIRALDRIRAGESPEDIAKTLGFNRTTVYRWIARFAESGKDGLKSRKAPGKPSTLTPFQLRRVFYVLVDKNPVQLRFPFALWTCELVGEFIQREFNVTLHRTTINRILAKLGFSFQRPLQRAYEQDMDLVKKWKKHEFPRIQALAKKENAEIFFQDETGIRSDETVGRTWGRIGKTPIVKMTGKRFSLNVISAVSPGGTLRFMVLRDTFNGKRFLDFLKRMLQGAKRKIFLVVDGHPAHRSGEVKEFLKSEEKRIQLFFLPPYSPELNPDELVWSSLKGKIRKSALAGPNDLASKVFSHMTHLQKTPTKVRAFFQEEHVRYAAAC
jgi:transposase